MHFPSIWPTISSRRIAAVVAGFAILVAAAAGASAPAAADDTAGVGGGPADSAGADGRTNFAYSIDPGQTVDDHVIVQNTGSVPQVITVYATDAFNTEDGGYGLLETAVEPVDIGTWVRFESDQPRVSLSLNPGESRVLAFTVTVPVDALPGDHAGGVVVSAASADAQVIVDRRVATRLTVRVAGELQPGLSVTQFEARHVGDWWNPFSGAVEVDITVENVGNVNLGADMFIGTTAFGIPVGTNQRVIEEAMLPGTTFSSTYLIPDIGQLGLLFPFVSITPTYAENLPSPGAAPIDRSGAVVAVPWAVLMLLVIALVVVLVVRWRRRVDEQRAAEWIAWTQAEALRTASPEPVGAGAPRGDSGS